MVMVRKKMDPIIARYYDESKSVSWPHFLSKKTGFCIPYERKEMNERRKKRKTGRTVNI